MGFCSWWQMVSEGRHSTNKNSLITPHSHPSLCFTFRRIGERAAAGGNQTSFRKRKTFAATTLAGSHRNSLLCNILSFHDRPSFVFPSFMSHIPCFKGPLKGYFSLMNPISSKTQMGMLECCLEWFTQFCTSRVQYWDCDWQTSATDGRDTLKSR